MNQVERILVGCMLLMTAVVVASVLLKAWFLAVLGVVAILLTIYLLFTRDRSGD